MVKDDPSGREKSSGGEPSLPPGLYIVATPIGNLRDITLRALDVLKAADVIACEDTRTSRTLLSHYGINTATVPYHDHSDSRRRDALLDRVAAGEAVALVSDAGTPLISDPGFKLVREAREKGLRVEPVPGASSVLAALCASGSPTDRFLFAGFLPTKTKARREVFAELGATRATLVFMESAKRLPSSLADMAAGLGNRRAVVAREITKLHETFRDGLLPDLAAAYAEEGPPRGEVVIVVDPPGEAEAPSGEAVDALLQEAFAAGDSTRDAADRVAAETGLPRRQVYQRALALSGR
ncbi:16S rRNA (cytidine(1402)-2'-O)-methyltransferase [Hwanghaeella sp.]|uniref:16S rRNA (cytidine(1402)-2'-O)-methyltransferase n=1 Tax=Hwanghaeella sp. TaxID=2605943 RepID=UPI003CCC2528